MPGDQITDLDITYFPTESTQVIKSYRNGQEPYPKPYSSTDPNTNKLQTKIPLDKFYMNTIKYQSSSLLHIHAINLIHSTSQSYTNIPHQPQLFFQNLEVIIFIISITMYRALKCML